MGRFELAVEILGEAIESALARIARRRSHAIQWFREVTRPPPGLLLHAPDGSAYTGLILVDSNKAVVVLALRRLPHDQPRSLLDAQYEIPFSHRGAPMSGADDLQGRLRF